MMVLQFREGKHKHIAIGMQRSASFIFTDNFLLKKAPKKWFLHLLKRKTTKGWEIIIHHLQFLKGTFVIRNIKHFKYHTLTDISSHFSFVSSIWRVCIQIFKFNQKFDLIRRQNWNGANAPTERLFFHK